MKGNALIFPVLSIPLKNRIILVGQGLGAKHRNKFVASTLIGVSHTQGGNTGQGEHTVTGHGAGAGAGAGLGAGAGAGDGAGAGLGAGAGDGEQIHGVVLFVQLEAMEQSGQEEGEQEVGQLEDSVHDEGVKTVTSIGNAYIGTNIPVVTPRTTDTINRITNKEVFILCFFIVS